MLISLALALLLPIEGDAVKPKVGEQAPAFSLPSSNGKTITLAEFKGKKKVVLAFYPKAFTGGCSKEMSGLKDHKTQFDEAATQVLGISLDNLDTQSKFADSLKLPFPLLADKNGTVATAYGVKGLLWANRTTFVIDETGKITAIFEGKDAIDPALTLAACTRKSH